MGSIFKQSTPTPPPPAPPAGYRDEIGGTEQVPVKNADGTTTYITRKLALTPAQQAEKDAYDKIMKDALSEIEKLSSSSYAVDDSTQKILNAWSDERKEMIDDSFDVRETQEEKRLAKRGLGSSSAADAVRRQRRLDEQKEFKVLENEKTLMKDDVRRQNLSYQQNLYNIASTQDNLEQAKVMKSASGGISAVNAANSYNRASIMDYYNRQSSAAQQGSQLLGQTLGAVEQIGGSISSGGFGSLFKNLF